MRLRWHRRRLRGHKSITDDTKPTIPDLTAISTQDLTSELRRRGVIPSIWSHADLDWLLDDADEDIIEQLEETQIEGIMMDLLAKHARTLEDKLASTGNDFLGEVITQKDFNAKAEELVNNLHSGT